MSFVKGMLLILLLMPLPYAYAQFSFVEVLRDNVEEVDGLSEARDVAVSPDNQFVYVAAEGEDAIGIFKRDLISGELTYMGKAEDGVEGVGGLAGVVALEVSADGDYLYSVAEEDHSINTFSIDEEGRLTLLQTLSDGSGGVDGLAGARALSLSPEGNNIYVAAYEDHAVSVFAINASDGRLSFVQAIVDQADMKLQTANAVACSPDGKHVYVTAYLDDGISVFERDSEGKLNNVQNIDNWAQYLGFGNARPTDICISASNTEVYVSGYGGSTSGNLTVFSRNTDNGTLSKVQGFTDDSSLDDVNFTRLAPLGRLTSIALNPENSYVFTTGDESSGDTGADFRVSSFQRAEADGRLTPYQGFGEATVEGVAQPKAVAFSQDGNYFYVASAEGALSVLNFLLPEISSISPQEAYAGMQLSLSGKDFGHEQANSTVKFGEAEVTKIISWTDTLILLELPEMQASVVDVSLTVNNYSHVFSEKFTVEDKPLVLSISSLSAAQGKSGSELTITGTKFGSGEDSFKVLFGEKEAASANRVSEEEIRATVPEMKEASLPIAVIVNGDTVFSPTNFRVDNTAPQGELWMSDADGFVRKGQSIFFRASFNEDMLPTVAVELDFILADERRFSFKMNRSSAREYTLEYEVGNEAGEVRLAFSGGEDLSANSVQAEPLSSQSYVTLDVSPKPTFSPTDKSVGVAVNSKLSIQFDKPVRTTDNKTPDTNYLAQALVLEEVRQEGNAALPFTASYNSTTYSIQLTPNNLEDNKVYRFSLQEGYLEDLADHAVAAEHVIFSTGDTQELIVIPQHFALGKDNSGQVLLNVNDASFIKKALLYVRGITNYAPWVGPLNLLDIERILSGNAFYYPFEALDDPIGLEYYYEFTDKFDQLKKDTVYLYKKYEDGIDIPARAGRNQADYRLVSFPLELEEKGVEQTLKALGKYDKEKWRFFRLGKENKFEEYDSFHTLSSGKAYLLLHTYDALEKINSGSGETVKVHKQKGYKIALQPGWNMIGNPFPFDIDWEKVRIHPDNQHLSLKQDLLGYSENWDSVVYELPVGSGALLHVEEGGTQLSIPISARQQSDAQSRIGKATAKTPGWQLGLHARAVSYRLKRTLSGLGMHPDASESLDAYDLLSPPAFGHYLNLNFRTDKASKNAIIKSIVPTQNQYVWSFEVDTDVRTSIVLSWNNEQLPADGQAVFLHDNQTERLINMRIQNSYTFEYTATRRFSVVYGSDAFLKEQLQPTSVSLNPLYPNPFHALVNIPFALPNADQPYEVRVIIYNNQGKRVRELYGGILEGGFHSLKWDGTSSSGHKLASGVYFCRLRVSTAGQLIERRQKVIIGP